MKYILAYRPEIIAFFSGALVMVFEILGARIVGPYIGTSLFVWTSIIAVILGALSLGCYYGGKLADRGVGLVYISQIFFLSSITILLLIVGKSPILQFITSYITDIRLSSIVLATILFSPTSFLLGLIPPIITKIQIRDLESGGRVIGRIGSIGTVGSIIGTLAAGFFLIPFFGVRTLLILLGIFCIILSFFCDFKKYFLARCVFLIIFLGSYSISGLIHESLASSGIREFDTSYSHITIQDSYINESTPIRNLMIDNVTHAGMYLNSDALLHEYTKYYHLFDVFSPQAKDVLMLGGAAYSFPKSFLKTYGDKNIDVVEIDPEITQLAEEFFGLPKDDRLSIIHEDARVFLNSSGNRYDVILGDAFGSYFSIPYQLTTQEAVRKTYDLLSDDGIVILNIIGSLQGKNSHFVQAQYKTYQSVFPEVFIIPVQTPNKYTTQNVMLVAAKNPDSLNSETDNTQYQTYLSKRTYLELDTNTQILTDDFAPVDYYVGKMVK